LFWRWQRHKPGNYSIWLWHCRHQHILFKSIDLCLEMVVVASRWCILKPNIKTRQEEACCLRVAGGW
jgi:hypothetical protein